jgi:PAS domain S-box-containing protein
VSVRLVAWLAALHVALAVLAALALGERRAWLLAVEAALVASLLLGASLVRRTALPLEMLRTGTDLLREGDFTARLAPTGQPELDALAGVYNEMADRLRSERTRLVEQDLFLERLVDASPAGVVTLDLDSRVSLVSPSAERLLGVRSAEAVGRAVGELGVAGAALAEVPLSGSRLLDVDGRTLRVRRAEFRDRGFPRAFYLVEELTEELRARERDAHGRIVQVMAHEVRNTVGAVTSLLESVAPLGRDLPTAARADFESAIPIAARRLLGLNAFMNAVADVVRLPAPMRAPCDVAQLVEDVVTLMAPDAEARGLSLEWRREAELGANVDKNQIEQAMLNVLQNALEATPPGGRVVVRLWRDESTVVLAIRDGGPGISPDVRRGLADPFFTTKRGGRGVGLMLVREVLSRHGLPFTLESHPDGGAEFRVVFLREREGDSLTLPLPWNAHPARPSAAIGE